MTIKNRIQKTLQYFQDEFPEHQHAHLWQAPVCRYAGGITPNDLVEILRMIEPPTDRNEGHYDN